MSRPLATALIALAVLAATLFPGPARCQGFESLVAAKSPQCDVYLGRKTKAPATREAVRCRFVEFAGQWMGIVNRSLRHSESSKQVLREGGVSIARFVRLAPSTATFSIKPSSSGSAAFVGVLRYEEHHFEGRGPTDAAAVEGPFQRVRRMRITQIFRFVGGRWVN